jgi:hypothetical protein
MNTSILVALFGEIEKITRISKEPLYLIGLA